MGETKLHELAAMLPPDIREQFQIIFGKITATWAEINALAGSGIVAADFTKLHALTATAAEINKLAGVTAGTVTASKALVAGAYKNLDSLFFGTVESAALVQGGGTSASPLATSSADKNFLGYWARTTAASGDNRFAYLRYYLGGAGGGECLRAFTTVEAASGTAHGAHLSLSFGVSPAALSGLGVACRNTLHIPNRAVSLGTMAAHQAEVYMDGTSADPTATRLALYRGVVDGGDVTAQNKLTHLWDLVNLGAGIFANQSAWSVSKVLKVCVNGTDYYLPLSTAA